jgi:hypothetical protein
MSNTSRRSEVVKAIGRFLDDHNVKDWRYEHKGKHPRYEHKGKHPRIVVNRGGREVFVVIPSSSTNWRARYYAFADLRRVLNLREARP